MTAVPLQTLPFRLQFRPGVVVHAGPESRTEVVWPGGTFRLGPKATALNAVVTALANGGATAPELAALVVATAGGGALKALDDALQLFQDRGIVRETLEHEGQPFATVEPSAPSFRFAVEDLAADQCYVLSRFTCCRRDGDALVLESPLASGRVLVHSPAAASLLALLAAPQPCDVLAAAVPGIPPELVLQFLGILLAQGMVCAAEEDGRPREDTDPTLRQWEFHDLLFHWKTRLGGHSYPYGATFPFADELPPLPALKPHASASVVDLYRPDLSAAARRDPSFSAVLEGRQSLRQYDQERPLSVEQLGEFLYRAAGVISVKDADPERGQWYETSRRPYPGGGAGYALEIYPVVSACEGLAPGAYSYLPGDHTLTLVAEPGALSKGLLQDAQRASGAEHPPQVLFVVTARFQRLSWKYQAVAYALLLKDVGALYQTMYLTATAMGLAPCALGGGNSQLSAQVFDLDPLVEASVGEFMLGSRQAAGG